MTRWVPLGIVLVALGLLAIRWPGSSSAAQPQPRAVHTADLFTTSHSCLACHNGLTTPTGEDVSIGFNWRASMMANSARDPYWQAAVRRETMDHPEAAAAIEDECSKCHMPMARYAANAGGGLGTVFEHLPIGSASTPADLLAADGVSCALCHQITDEGLGTEASLTGNFRIDTERPDGERAVFGPFEIEDNRIRLMQSTTGFRQTEASHIQDSELCATCHTLITHALGPDGEVIGELPEQTPYQEWLASDYRTQQSCQDCHMPEVEAPAPISSVLGEEREGLSRHSFRGGNAFMLRMLQRYRSELGVEALPQELELAARDAQEHLEKESARVRIERARIEAGRIEAEVVIESLAGHKLPTAYPSRRVWLELTVRDAGGAVLFQSGALGPDGQIEGNDNDADPRAYEPHYEAITEAGEVQIYESILVDSTDAVTTGLLHGVRYVKDNRLLPTGFDKGCRRAGHRGPRARRRGRGLRCRRGSGPLLGGSGRGARPAHRGGGPLVSVHRISLGRKPAPLRRPGNPALRRLLRCDGFGLRDRDGARRGLGQRPLSDSARIHRLAPDHRHLHLDLVRGGLAGIG